MHSVVTVKAVVNFNDANIFCTTRNNIRCRQVVMRARTVYQKTEGVAETKKVKDNSNARECDEKGFIKEKMMPVDQPSESANTKNGN